jgi:Domain of unknown function (DUF4112)
MPCVATAVGVFLTSTPLYVIPSWHVLIVGLIPIVGPMWASSLSRCLIVMAEDAQILATLVAQMSVNVSFHFIVACSGNAKFT